MIWLWRNTVLLAVLGVTCINQLKVVASQARSFNASPLDPSSSKIEILALFSGPDVGGERLSSVSSQVESSIAHGTSADFVVVNISEVTFGNVLSPFTAVGDSQILYDDSKWELFSNSRDEELISTFWARFRLSTSFFSSSEISTTPVTVCMMTSQWDNSSWSQPSAITVAAEVVTRLDKACGANDTIALVFSSTVCDVVADYLEGMTAESTFMSPLTLLDVSDSLASRPSSSISNRVFFRPGSGTCTQPLTASPSAGDSMDVLAVKLLTGVSCGNSTNESIVSSNATPPASPPTEDDDGSSSIASETGNDSSWEQKQSFVVLVCCVIFLLGSGGLIYVLRRRQYFRSSQTSKDEKELTTKLAYVLSI